jgi:hypothetical protein
MKENKPVIHAITWKGLKRIMLSENKKSQFPNVRYWMIPPILHSQNDKNYRDGEQISQLVVLGMEGRGEYRCDHYKVA